MVASSGSSTSVVRRQLGKKLEAVRKGVGMTRADVEHAHIASETKLWRVETGKTAVKPGFVWELGELYDLPDEVRRPLMQLANGTRGTGWWEEYGSAVVPNWLSLYAGLESGASTLDLYEPELVHGLLQTPDYARAVIRSIDGLSEGIVEQRLAFRLERQRTVLERPHPAKLRVVFGAGALALVVGSPDIMQRQIEHLMELNERNSVDVRIIPWNSGPHPWMMGAFAILDFDDVDDPSLIHTETHAGVHYMERPEQLTEFRRRFQVLYDRATSIREYRS